MILFVTIAFLCFGAGQARSVPIGVPVDGCPDKCKDLPLELSFVIDASASIWTNNFTIGLWFVQNFVDRFNIGPDTVRVSAVSYGERVYEEDAFNFNTYTDKTILTNAISNIPYKAGGATETGAAIRYLLDQQLPQARPAVRRVIVVLTDGNSQKQDVTKAEADRARSENLEVFVIGVGNGISQEELHNIASDGTESCVSDVKGQVPQLRTAEGLEDYRHVFNVDTYNALNDIINRLQNEVCEKIPQPPCKHDPADIAFVIDSSSSIGEKNFTLGLEFIKEFLEEFEINPSSIRVAAVMFGQRVHTEDAISFDANKTKKDTIDAILGLKWHQGTRTETGLGIDYMVDTFLPNTRPTAAHISIVITDGKSQAKQKTAESAEIARSKGVQMFAVGVGVLGKSLDVEELNNIAGSPDRVLTVVDYAHLNSIKKKLTNIACVGIEQSLKSSYPVQTQP